MYNVNTPLQFTCIIFRTTYKRVLNQISLVFQETSLYTFHSFVVYEHFKLQVPRSKLIAFNTQCYILNIEATITFGKIMRCLLEAGYLVEELKISPLYVVYLEEWNLKGGRASALN